MFTLLSHGYFFSSSSGIPFHISHPFLTVACFGKLFFKEILGFDYILVMIACNVLDLTKTGFSTFFSSSSTVDFVLFKPTIGLRCGWIT